MKAIRQSLRVAWTEKQSNECVLQKLGLQSDLIRTVKRIRVRYFGHVTRKCMCLEKYTIEGTTWHKEDQRLTGWKMLNRRQDFPQKVLSEPQVTENNEVGLCIHVGFESFC